MNTATLDTIYDLLSRVATKLDVPINEAPPPTNGIVFPLGTIKTPAPNGSTRWSGVPWTRVSRWEPFFTQAGEEFGIAPLLLAVFSLVETNSQHYRSGNATGPQSDVIERGEDAYDKVPAVGIMQVKLGYHADALPDADGYTPQGNIRLAAKLLSGWIKELGSWEAALTERYHPGDDPGSGVTQQEYIRAIRGLIAEVKGEVVPAPPAVPTSNPFRKPKIYNLSGDYARFGLTRQETDRILGNRFESRNGGSPKFIVNHIQDGTTPGSLDWWANGAGVQASSTVMANRDGSILRIIPENHGPWTSGDVCSPTANSASIRALGGNPNQWSLSLEAEGTPGISTVSYTDAQLQAILWQFAEWMIQYGIPLANVISHASLNQCSRANCPGNANHLAVLDELKQAGLR